MSRRASSATSTSYARGDRATSMSPLVSRSRRCTMPGRAGSPTSESSGNRSSSPSTSVPASRRWLLTTGCPPTSTAPSSMRRATSARLQPVRSARARSSRSPANVAGTASSLTPPSSRGVAPLVAVAPSPHQEQHGADRDRGVGDVEGGERTHTDEVDDLAAQESRRAEQPIDEVAQRAAEHERERDDHDRVSRALGDADEHDGDDRCEYGEQRREPGQDAERAPGIAAQSKLDGIADDRKRPVGEGRDDPRLRDLVKQDDADNEPEDQEGSTRRTGGARLGGSAPASGVVRHVPCSPHTPRRTEWPRGARPRGDARRARTLHTSPRPSASRPGRSRRRSVAPTPTASGRARARR